eukprot:871530_1
MADPNPIYASVSSLSVRPIQTLDIASLSHDHSDTHIHDSITADDGSNNVMDRINIFHQTYHKTELDQERLRSRPIHQIPYTIAVKPHSTQTVWDLNPKSCKGSPVQWCDTCLSKTEASDPPRPCESCYALSHYSHLIFFPNEELSTEIQSGVCWFCGLEQTKPYTFDPSTSKCIVCLNIVVKHLPNNNNNNNDNAQHIPHSKYFMFDLTNHGCKVYTSMDITRLQLYPNEAKAIDDAIQRYDMKLQFKFIEPFIDLGTAIGKVMYAPSIGDGHHQVGVYYIRNAISIPPPILQRSPQHSIRNPLSIDKDNIGYCKWYLNERYIAKWMRTQAGRDAFKSSFPNSQWIGGKGNVIVIH